MINLLENAQMAMKMINLQLYLVYINYFISFFLIINLLFSMKPKVIQVKWI